MARILVTGGSGFVGWGVPALLLERGHEVHLVCRSPDQADWPPRTRAACIIHAADLRADDTPARIIRAVRPTHLVHFAWYAEPGRFRASPLNLDWTAASLRLYRAFAESGGERFVGCGTCAEYDWRFHTLSEATTPLVPATLYGTAKASLFRMLEAASGQGGPGFAWGRVFFPFGPRERPGRLLPDVITALLAGREVAVSEGRQICDFLAVEDAARAFAALVCADISGAVNIASGIGTSVRALVEATAARIGRPELVRFGARPTGPDEVPYIVADVRRLRDELHCLAPLRLGDALDETIAWWRERTQCR
jgi:nucleoside-diphosphate-sugar epimerase